MKICICGYGSIGKRHGRILRKLGYEYDVISIDYDKSNGDYLKKYDLVFICTPTASHLDDAKKFINTDYFFIEKSLDSDFNKIFNKDSILKNKKIYVGYNLLHTNFYLSLKNKLKELKNNINYINVVSCSYLPDWRPNSEKKCYSFYRRMGGGVILDSSHEFNYIYNLLGKPVKTFNYHKRVNGNITVDCEDYCISIWEYENFIVKFEMNLFSKDHQRYCEVFDNNSNKYKFTINREDINQSYINQNINIIKNKISNSYDSIIEFNSILKKIINNLD